MEKKSSGYIAKRKEVLHEFSKNSVTATLNQTPKSPTHGYSRDKRY